MSYTHACTPPDYIDKHRAIQPYIGVLQVPLLNIVLILFCRIIEFARARLRKLFQEPAYKSFDMKEEDGQGLVGILMDLLKYEDDELRLSSVLLLFDIFQVSLSFSSFFPPPLSFHFSLPPSLPLTLSFLAPPLSPSMKFSPSPSLLLFQ